MRAPLVWKVAYKELLSTLRDRRTLTSIIIMPLVFIPLFTIAFPLLLSRTFGGQQEARQKVGIVGQANLPAELRERLTNDERNAAGDVVRAGVELVAVTDPVTAVRDGDVSAAIIVPENLPSQAGAGTASIRLVSKSSDQKAQVGAVDKVRDVLSEYNDVLVQRRLQELNFDTSFLTPVQVENVDAASAQERASGFLGFMIPYLLLQFILAGAMSTAIDSTAGEKERGTLEVLLVTPVRRLEVVVGKLLATTLFAIATAVFGVVGFALSGPLARLVLPADEVAGAFTAAIGGTLSITLTDFAVLLGVALSAALLTSALLLAITVFARSFKEAQTYLTPIALILIVPLLVLQFADFIDKNPALYLIPLMNVALVILDLIKGALTPLNAAVTVGSNIVYTLLLTMLALRSFNRESVIFRT